MEENKFVKNFTAFETVLSLLFAGGLLAFTIQISYNRYFLWVTDVLLASLYFFRGTRFGTINTGESLGSWYLMLEKLYWWGASVLIIGIPMKLLLYPNADNMLLLGVITMFVAVSVKTIFYNKVKVKWDVYVRFILLGIIGIFVWTF